ncbi:MAG: DNA repair exonuclease [Blautia sp.]|nr:DNA repair exonuclease [Blautia sp.]MDY3998039.1 DNA repair exonuclease [Blautia sp.]
MIRFIHLADVHLGAVPDRGCPWSREREEEIWETFRRVIASISKNPVDLLFIAGDLFHRQPLLRELKEVNYLFSTIPDTQVFVMAGNHDYLAQDSFYRTFQWEPNVVFFGSESPAVVKAKGLDAWVTGLSYEHREIREPVYDSLKPEMQDGFHVLLAHGGDESHIPMDMTALAASGFDYIALGHIHKPQTLMRDRMAYSGALEPIDRNDMGEHGYVEGRFENGQVRTKFVPFACRSYQKLILTVREDSTQFSLEEMMKMDIMKRGGKNIYKVVLQGCHAPETLLFPEKLKAFGNVAEILDETRPAYDLEALSRRYSGTLVGDYIEYFRKKDMTLVEEKALYYGLQALLESSTMYLK